MSLELKKCDIQGVFEIQPVVYSDNRGYFFEQYNSKKIQHAGLEIEFVQDNISFSKKKIHCADCIFKKNILKRN